MQRRALLGIGLLGLLSIGFLWAQRKPTPTAEANWVWFDEGDPVASAPAATRYFRHGFSLDTVPAKAVLDITADNGFTVWLNGVQVGEGNSWSQLYRFDVRKHLKPGKNVLAVEGRNEGGPAGLVVQLGTLAVSGKDWKAAKTAAKGWRDADFDEKGWTPVKVIGPRGKAGPWSGGGVASGPAKPRTFKVPEGFKVELAVKRPDDRGPFSLVNLCFDAKGRLLLSQENGPILLATKPDKDGVFQEVVEYGKLVQNCQGMCWVGDALLLVGNGPKGTGLYRCKDTDGDDRLDKAELLHNAQGGMGEHGPHAVVHGPDGWLYVVVGNHSWLPVTQLADNSPLTRWPKGTQGPDQGQPGTTEDVLLPRLNDANGHAANIRAPGGTIWRLDHEGKNASLFSAGYRNQFDAAFNPLGELFSFDSDMEWDEGLPWYRHVRVNHATPGSDFVWRTGAANTPNYYLDSLPPTVETGRGSPVGVEFCDQPAFPDKYRGAFFMCDWSIGVIYAVHLKRAGGSYKAETEKFCTGSPLNVTDCVFGPDGALYFTLGGRGSEGGVQRIVCPERKAALPKQETTPGLVGILGQPQPLSAWGRANLRKLWDDSPDAVKTVKSTLVLKDATAALADRLKLLGVMQTQQPGLSLSLLTELLQDKQPEMRAQAAWAIGVQGYKDALRPLVKALQDEDALVRRRACEALVRARLEPPVEALGPVLIDDDIFVRTAARLVLERIDPAKWAPRLFRTDSKRLLREGIVALCKIGKANDHSDAIFDRLHEGSPGEEVQNLLAYLRTVQLALIHTTKRPGSVRGLALDCLEMFPHADKFVNRELAIVLTQLRREKILDEPVHAKLLEAIEKVKDDRPQQIHYFYCLRLLHEDWTKEQKARLLAWFDGTRTWSGGASYAGFLKNIFKDLGPAFTPEDRIEVLAKADKMKHAALALLLSTPETQLTAPEMQPVLRQLTEAEPALRDQALLALAKNVNADTWPLVLKGLDATNQQVLFESIQALRRSALKPKPDEAKPFRALLLASGRLNAGNRGPAVELLRHWGGNKRFSTEEKDWQTELAGWSKWFGQAFPKEAALPNVSDDKPAESKWKFAELLAYLEGEGKNGDIKKGRVAFEKGLCFKCHKYGKEGEGLGPDLTTLSKRFKRVDTLDSLFHPSKVISDQYRSTLIVTAKGQQISGLAAPQGDTVTVLQSNGEKVTLKKGEIEQQLTSLVSVMPERLLDPLTKEEIRDLFAFLESEPEK